MAQDSKGAGSEEANPLRSQRFLRVTITAGDPYTGPQTSTVHIYYCSTEQEWPGTDLDSFM